MKIKYLSGKKADQVVELDEISAKSLIENGLAEEVSEADPMEAALKSLDAKITEAATKAAEQAALKTVESVSKGLSTSRIIVGPDNVTQDKTGGFKSMSHFLHEVRMSGNEGSNPTSSMKKWSETCEMIIKSTTGGNETTAADGGYAVPVQYQSNVFSMYGSVPDFFSQTFQVPMLSNNTKIPVVKNYDRSNSTVSAGVVAAAISEASNITQSKLQWEQLSLTLQKLAVMVPVSDELLEDNNVSLGSVVAEQANYQLKKQMNGGIINSAITGFTGIIGNTATKIVHRTTTSHIAFNDVLRMYSLFAHDDASYETAVWFCNPTTLPEIGGMTVTSTGQAIYFPPGGAANGKVVTLLGRPLIVTGWCPALGSAGDLLLVDLKKYVTGYKGGVVSAVSPHVFFLTHEQAFRFTMRVTGKPGLTGKITLEDGSTTVSPFVELGSSTLSDS